MCRTVAPLLFIPSSSFLSPRRNGEQNDVEVLVGRVGGSIASGVNKTSAGHSEAYIEVITSGRTSETVPSTRARR